MKSKFHPAAAEELWAACRYYAEIDAKLGLLFLRAVEEALVLIVRHPAMGAELEAGIRRHVLRRFPYGLYYSVEQEQVMVLAVMHLKRRPGYWRERRD